MPSSSRRAVLRTLGVAAAAFAGCQEARDSSGSSTGTDLHGTGTPTATATPTTTGTASPTPEPVDERCEGRWDPVARWRYATGVRSYRPAVVDDVVYFAAQGPALYALDAADGSVRWRADQDVRLFGRTVVADGAAVVSTYDEVAAYAAADGAHRWTFHVPGETGVIETDAAADGGRVFFAAHTEPGTQEETAVPPYHRLYAVGLAGGESVWTVELSTDDAPVGVAAADGRVYTSTRRGRTLRAFDAVTGERAWSRQFGGRGGHEFEPIPGANSLFVRPDGAVAAVSPADGTVRWRRDSSFEAGPVVGGDAVYCATRRKLVALDAATGRRRWQAALPVNVGAVVGATGETVYVALERDDRVEVLGVDADAGCRIGRYVAPARRVTRGAFSADTMFLGGLKGDGELFAVTRPGRRET